MRFFLKHPLVKEDMVDLIEVTDRRETVTGEGREFDGAGRSEPGRVGVLMQLPVQAVDASDEMRDLLRWKEMKERTETQQPVASRCASIEAIVEKGTDDRLQAIRDDDKGVYEGCYISCGEVVCCSEGHVLISNGGLLYRLPLAECEDSDSSSTFEEGERVVTSIRWARSAKRSRS